MLASELLHILAVNPSHGVIYHEGYLDTLAKVLTEKLMSRKLHFSLK